MTCFSFRRSFLWSVLATAGLFLAPAPASGQYMGSNFHGDFGVNSGSQAAPGFYVAVPFAQWNINHIKNADGAKVVDGLFQGFDYRA